MKALERLAEQWRISAATYRVQALRPELTNNDRARYGVKAEVLEECADEIEQLDPD